MSNEIASSAPSPDPIPRADPQTARWIAILRNDLVASPDGSHWTRHPLLPAERTTLERRRFEISDGLLGASDAQIGVVLTKFLSAYPTQRIDGAETVAAGMSVWVASCRGLPLWAIRETCLRFSRGTAGNTHRAPTSAEFVQEVERYIAHHRADLATVEAILNAKPEPDEDPAEVRARAVAKWEREREARREDLDQEFRAQQTARLEATNAIVDEYNRTVCEKAGFTDGKNLSLGMRLAIARELARRPNEGSIPDRDSFAPRPNV